MSATPKVSIIIPNYNHSQFLNQRIDSVLNQTFEDFEVIILDDCSKDSSIQVIETYRNHPKVSQIVINETNSGSPFLQWDKGIKLARGEWIWVAESDDWCEPDFLENLLNMADDNVALVFCQSLVIDENGQVFGQTNWPSQFERSNGKKFIRDYLSEGNYIVNASMCIFRKKLYERVSNEFLRYKFSGDWVLWIELATMGDVVASGKHLNYFRKHKGDISGKASKEGLVYKEYFMLLDRMGEDKIIPPDKREEIFKHNFYVFLNNNIIENKYRKEIYKQFRSKIGVRIYYFHFKNFVVSKIIKKLRQRIKKVRMQQILNRST